MARWSWLLRPHRHGLALLVGLVMIEQLAWLVEPFVFGRVIDALLAHHQKSRGFRYLLIHLAVWLAIFVVNSVTGVVRRVSTARVSGQLYTGLVTSLAERGLTLGEAPERTAAKAELSRELVEFFDTRMPMLVAGVMNVVGALVALYTFDTRIATACLLLVLPLAFVNRVVNRRLSPLERQAHDDREVSFAMFAERDPEKVRGHFAKLGAVQRRIAILSSINFGSLRAALLAVFVSVLYIAIDIDDFTTGRLYSVVAYLWTFVSYAEDFPKLVESGSSLGDLLHRLSSEESVAPAVA